ncbi:hypothetical protein NQ314_012022 [Rhamnusium bicolor]|uniref:type I protein arginine methyltransferase n=1 Tax=Rhamnusium bicolor TaxID=1586634 RepID=A0AAV8XDZ2_9CUCU|nr:hypothetical protein NQ314_012022 [Rhamnusium bicolor]
MLQDHPRNKAYRDAILSNKDDFKDKIVLDIGAGSGILSVFCAQAGAKTVYAVEASNIYKIAEETAKENDFQDVIKVIHSIVEEAILPQKVDIIVSEWMGFYLLHEAMLNSVIVARDKFLKPDGLLFPESATLYSVPCSVSSMFDFWESVDGVSMQHFGKSVRENASKKPITELVSPESLLCDPEVVIWLDLREVTLEDINTIQMRHIAVANKHGKYQGIFLFLHTFDVCRLPT